MNELLIAIISSMLAYFFLRLDSLEKKIDSVENDCLKRDRRRQAGEKGD